MSYDHSLSCSCVINCFLSTRDGSLVDESLEHAGEDTSKCWGNQIDWQVRHLDWLGLGVGVTIEKSLENGLDEADGWVDASTRDATSNNDGSVQGKSNSETVDWHVGGSVVIDNLADEGNEECGHDHFNQEDRTSKLAIIVAASSWTKLRDVMGSWCWECLVVLWEPDHGCGAGRAPNHSSKELE